MNLTPEQRQEINKLVAEGYARVQRHPDLPLEIYNYSQKAQIERFWEGIMPQLRGLVVNTEDDEIVMKPFPKFFNIEEHNYEIPLEPFEIFEKMDGSLLLARLWRGMLLVATRGSFTSEQAVEGQKIIMDYAGAPDFFNPHVTYLFEVIYPENRIVVNYGGMRDVVLLGAYGMYTGEEIPLDKLDGIPFRRVNRMLSTSDKFTVHRSFFEDLQKDIKGDNEGYVIKFKNGFRAKIKGDEYKRLHKIVTGVSSVAIWEVLSNGGTLDEYLERVPDEFFKWVKDIDAELRHEFNLWKGHAEAVYVYASAHPTRREQAEFLLTNYKDIAPIVFKMLDNAPYEQLIWKKIRPAYEQPFKSRLEEAE